MWCAYAHGPLVCVMNHDLVGTGTSHRYQPARAASMIGLTALIIGLTVPIIGLIALMIGLPVSINRFESEGATAAKAVEHNASIIAVQSGATPTDPSMQRSPTGTPSPIEPCLTRVGPNAPCLPFLMPNAPSAWRQDTRSTTMTSLFLRRRQGALRVRTNRWTLKAGRTDESAVRPPQQLGGP